MEGERLLPAPSAPEGSAQAQATGGATAQSPVEAHEQPAAGDDQRFDADGGGRETQRLAQKLFAMPRAQGLAVDAAGELVETLSFAAELGLKRSRRQRRQVAEGAQAVQVEASQRISRSDGGV